MSVFVQDWIKREVRNAEKHGLVNLGLFPSNDLPEELFAVKNLRGLSLGIGQWDMLDGQIERYSMIDEEDEEQFSEDRPFNKLELLQRFPDLEVLELSCCRGFQSLEPLTKLPKLRALLLYGCDQLTDFTPLLSIPTLEYLDVCRTQLHDLSVLAGMPNLKKLDFLTANPQIDFHSLAALPHLEELYFKGMGADVDLGFLDDLKHLRTLTFFKVEGVSDWTPVGRLRGLEFLGIYLCPTLKRFAPLADLLPELKTLKIRQKLTDLPMAAQSEHLIEGPDYNYTNCAGSARTYWKEKRKVSKEWLQRLANARRDSESASQDAALNPRLTPPVVEEQVFDKLRQAVQQGLRELRADGTLPTVEQGLYIAGVFAMSCNQRSYLVPFANADESCIGNADSVFETISSDGECNWLPSEYWCINGEGYIAEEANNAVVKAYTQKDGDSDLWDHLADDVADEAHDEMFARTLVAIAQALKDSDDEGFFGTGEARKNVVLLAGKMDDEGCADEATMMAGVKYLNGAVVLKEFVRAYAEESGLEQEDAIAAWAKPVLASANKSDFAKRLAKLA